MQEDYRREVEKVKNEAAEYVRTYVEAFRASFPGASVAELRTATVEAINESLNAFAPQASEIALDLFDQITAAEGFDVSTEIHDVIDPEMVDKKVRFFAKYLVNNDVDNYGKNIRDITKYYVERSALENMIKNCEANEVGWARVPSGFETCSFCFMLSSRGFVYESKESAGGTLGRKFHRGCDCIVVPGVDGITKIDGYNSDLLYERWKICANTVGIKNEDVDKVQYAEQIRKEVEKRDWRWLYSSDKNYSSRVGKQSGAKPLPKEWDLAGLLSRNGFEVFFLKEAKDKKSPDALLNGRVWEFKVPEAYNKKTVKNQFKKSLNKGTDSIVITNINNDGSMNSFISDIEKILKSNDFLEIREVLFVDRTGTTRRFKR